MRALLINPGVQDVDNFITEIDLPDGIEAMQKAIGCDCFTGIPTSTLGEDHVGYVDDEGLINGAAQKVGTFRVRDYEAPLAGRGLIMGFDPETGESKDATMTIEQAQTKIGYVTSIGPIFRA